MSDLPNELESFAGSFHRVERSGETLRLRFFRGFTFEMGWDRAVLVVELDRCEQIETMQSTLTEMAGEEIDGFEIERLEGHARIEIDFCWARDGRSVVLSARTISARSEPHSIEDYHHEIQALQRALQAADQKNRRQLVKIRNIRQRLVQQIRRGKQKAEFFASRNATRAAAQTATVDALAGVLSNLEELED